MKVKKIILSIFLCLIVLFSINSYGLSASAEEEKLYIGGFTAGFTINTNGAVVIGLSDVISENGIKSPSKDAEIVVGDIIVSINGDIISDSEDISTVLEKYKDEEVSVQIRRNGKTIIKSIKPIKDIYGKYKIGVFVRDELNGIGTITYIDKNYNFGSLGHPILDDKGKLIDVKGGVVYRCSVIGYVKGERGNPGELKGIFIQDKELGKISKNNAKGLYGKINKSAVENLTEVKVGEASIGKASIKTCIDGITVKEYSINIVKVDKNNNENKNLVVKITDTNLLNATNGILQGMSGSPIIQNGKIVGAITHVFINDPTRGYGILINKMLTD